MERGLSVSIGVLNDSLFEEAASRNSGGPFFGGARVGCAAVDGGGGVARAAVDVESTILMGTRLLFADNGFEDGVGAGGTDLGYASINKPFVATR